MMRVVEGTVDHENREVDCKLFDFVLSHWLC